MAASTTSLTVPPSPLRTCLISSMVVEAHAQRRWGPIGPFKVESGVGRTTPAHDPRPLITSLALPSACRGTLVLARTARSCS